MKTKMIKKTVPSFCKTIIYHKHQEFSKKNVQLKLNFYAREMAAVNFSFSKRDSGEKNRSWKTFTTCPYFNFLAKAL